MTSSWPKPEANPVRVFVSKRSWTHRLSPPADSPSSVCLQGLFSASTCTMTSVSWTTLPWKRMRWGLKIFSAGLIILWGNSPSLRFRCELKPATFIIVSPYSPMQVKWCWEAGTRRTSTSSPPVAGNLTILRRSGTSTRWEGLGDTANGAGRRREHQAKLTSSSVLCLSDPVTSPPHSSSPERKNWL